MEIWDGYNEKGEKLGRDFVRGIRLPDGCYHLACGVIVRHADGDFLVMLRDPDKKAWAGYYDLTAGGAALKGEDELTCIKRELFEETGLSSDSFEFISRWVMPEQHCIFFSYHTTVNCPKNSVRLQEGETVGYMWLTTDEFASFIKTERKIIPTQIAKYEPYFKSIGIL